MSDNKQDFSEKNNNNNNDWMDKMKKGFDPGNFKKGRFRFSLWYFVLVIIVLSLVNYFFLRQSDTLIEYSVFKEKVISGEIKRVKITPSYLYGYPYSTDNAEAGIISALSSQGSGNVPQILKTVPVEDPEFVSLLENNGIEYYGEHEQTNYFLELLLTWILPFGLLLIVWRFLLKRMGNLGGSNVMSFGQNNSKIVAEKDLNTRFLDVAGCDEAKDELVEVVDFLKTPEKYTKIGGKIPKGVLLVGPPGTGKTLMARAVAGEAEVTFFKMSGADFVEMFVGVGAARVRDLFKQARDKAPCIIFIDELDAIGKSRAGSLSSNDEREQTLNQLLVEMDGFDSTSGVIILAATNRPEILDPALLRPGRFDRQVLVDKPDLLGREAILKIHSENVKLNPDVDLNDIARATPGFVGADLANIINEAALLAVRNGRDAVNREDLHEAIEKTVAGLEKKSRLINPREREIVAYHETGHAMVAAFTPDADPVQKISIVPRGMGALGYTLQTPTEDRFLLTEQELIGRIDILLGGRAAEEIIYGKISTGASNDIMKGTDIIRSMLTKYGMSERFKNVALTEKQMSYLEGGARQREYSDNTQEYIDSEISRIMSERYSHVLKLLNEHRALLESITDTLLDREVIDDRDFMEMIKADESGSAALEKRLEKDMKVSERAMEAGKKRNDEIQERQRKRDEEARIRRDEMIKKAEEEVKKAENDSKDIKKL